jgi:AAA+ ATPase superfamily predicted ATPase
MKKAAIIVGKPNAGKSTTIREFKSIVKMESFHIFRHFEKRGYILSTSFEEADRDIEATIKKLSGFDYLVFACQGPKLSRVHQVLEKASFISHDIVIQPGVEARKKAGEIVSFFNSD